MIDTTTNLKQQALSTTAPPNPPTAGTSTAAALPPLRLDRLAEYPYAIRTSHVATLLDVSDRHVTELVATGRLAAIPGMGRNYRFMPAAVLAFLNGEAA